MATKAINKIVSHEKEGGTPLAKSSHGAGYDEKFCAEVIPAEDHATRINLSSLEDIRREMSRVYRDMRSGEIAATLGTRLVYVLGEIIRVFEASKVDKRLHLLEDVIKGRTQA